ncbi:MAG: 6-aminohexanoate-dimer hydrolase [Chloroflexi bacterium ADurb.Bin360]|nr:MAG: 6-aminohexanoate-dimer hydrolase [Chloroflexi bacterium ADurb.Bin360]
MNWRLAQARDRIILGLVCLSIVLSACTPAAHKSPASSPTAVLQLPTASMSADSQSPEDLPTATPEAVGMDSQVLAELITTLHETDSGVNAVLIVRHGSIALEAYFAPFAAASRQALFSCTKSVISALVGIALAEGAIESLDQPVLSFFPEHTFANVDARKERMTLRHLLTMTAGLEWHEAAPYIDDSLGRMVRSTDWVQFILDQPMATEPGEVFNYNSGVSHLLSAIIQQTAGKAAHAYAKEKLFGPLGFPAIPWQLDPQERSIGGWGLELTAREMAKIGYLYLHEGAWEGQQLVPAEWVKLSTTYHAGEENGRLGYGFQWWTIPELSPQAFSAIGRLGQYILVIPEQDLIVVFASADARPDLITLVRTMILPAIQSDTSIPDNPEALQALQGILSEVSRTK